MQLYIRKYNVRSYARFNFQVTVLMDGYNFDNSENISRTSAYSAYDINTNSILRHYYFDLLWLKKTKKLLQLDNRTRTYGLQARGNLEFFYLKKCI